VDATTYRQENNLGISEKLKGLASPGTSGSDIKSLNTPENWRSKMDVDDMVGGYVISQPSQAGNLPDAKQILIDFDMNPEDWTVTSVRRGKWQKFDGEYLESLRINIVPTRVATEDRLDAEKLVDEIKKWRPATGIKTQTGEGAFALFPSDQQIGKKTGNGGSEQSVDRILQLTESSVHRFKGLTKMGLNLGTIVLGLPGDHVEGIVSQGGRLQGLAASDLGLTEQVRVARRLLMSQIKAHAPLAERMIVPVINGNHDEVTRQVAADPADGWNVEIASAVQDACAENPALQHIEFRFPSSGHQTLTVDVNGTMLGLFHGHQSRDPFKYLSGQAAGQTALGMADVWVSGHFHNFSTRDIGERLWLQCPTTDPGSEWFRDRSGMNSKPGLLTMVLGGGYEPRENISVLAVK
jgi:predicted phosphodiesterase